MCGMHDECVPERNPIALLNFQCLQSGLRSVYPDCPTEVTLQHASCRVSAEWVGHFAAQAKRQFLKHLGANYASLGFPQFSDKLFRT